ncbi:MAG TPA: hypothetical protein VL099_08475 [Candidatus Binatia bacterium]|nr:hypothetical protein [Candidatus Binatia bacterium]
MIRWRKLGAGFLGSLLAMVCAARTGASGAPAAQKSKDKKPEAAAALLSADQGIFDILVDGKPAGTEEFDIRPNGGEWTARGSAEVAGENGARSKVTGKLQLTADGAPRRYEWSTSAPRKAVATVVFEGGVGTMELHVEGAAPYSQEFDFKTTAVVILDNNMYHQYAILAQLYDWEHKDSKTFPVLIPQDMTPGSVNVEYGGEQVLNGKKADVLRVHTQDLEVDLYCDDTPQHRLLRLAVPAAKAEVVRQQDKK